MIERIKAHGWLLSSRDKSSHPIDPSLMESEETGYIPVRGFLSSWSFCVWIVFGLLLFVHTLFVIPGYDSSNPDEESGDYESSEQREHLVGAHVEEDIISIE